MILRLGPLHLLIVAICIYDILRSNYDTDKKFLWIIIVIIIPIIGALMWLLVSRRIINL